MVIAVTAAVLGLPTAMSNEPDAAWTPQGQLHAASRTLHCTTMTDIALAVLFNAKIVA